MIVRTAAGLDALPGNTVVLDRDGDAWQKDELVGRWWEAKGWHGSSTAADIERYGPFRTMRPSLDDVVVGFTAEELEAVEVAAEVVRRAEDHEREGRIG